MLVKDKLQNLILQLVRNCQSTKKKMFLEIPLSNKIPMRPFLKIILFILLISNIAFGQISVRLFNYRPTGEFGSVMKPLFSAEIGFQSSFDGDRLRGGFSLTYLHMKPRMDVFPVYGVIGSTVFPGEQSFQKYNLGLLFADLDIAIVDQKKFNFFTGLGLIIGGANVDYTYNVQTAIAESYSGGGIIGGLRFRLGAEYILNDNIGIMLNANRSAFLLTDPRTLGWANDYGVGLKYSFD